MKMRPQPEIRAEPQRRPKRAKHRLDIPILKNNNNNNDNNNNNNNSIHHEHKREQVIDTD